MTNKLPKIPAKEWITLIVGIVLFSSTEVILFTGGYTNLLINTAVAIVLTAIINYTVFGIKNKLQKIVRAYYAINRAIVWFFHTIYNIILAIPKTLLIIVRAIGIMLLNLAMIPIFAVYLTIYGILISFTGGTNKIMMKHYDALGRRMTAPIEKYLHLEAIIAFIMIAIIAGIIALIITTFQSASSIATTNAANLAAGNSLTTFGTVASYLPVFIIIIVIAVIIFILRYFFAGAGAFVAAGT